MRPRAALILVAATSFLSGHACAAPVQSYDTYESWLVACDNTLSCTAKGFDEAGSTRSEMTIVRAAGPGAAATLTIRSERRFARDDVTADGAALPLRPQDWTLAAEGDGARLLSSDPEAVTAILASLIDAPTLSLGIGGSVPLMGLRAALLRMDARQGRVGTVTALVQPGDAPARRVPPAPPLPAPPRHLPTAKLTATEAKRLIARTRTAWAAALKAADCDGPLDGGSFEPEAHALDTGHALVWLPCYQGAYQGSALPFVAPRTGGGRITRLLLSTPYQGDADYQPVKIVTSPTFDDHAGVLGMFAKGRGLADCGRSASWAWDGRRFVLTAMTLQQACGGVEPGDWPVLYRTAK